ncbi:GtrA family protein [Cupriavidus plantarum]|uniref:GtrA family protein n=1 Tax=Cupriavidus plantarum TaxID=942865 RepID=UPI00339D6E5E
MRASYRFLKFAGAGATATSVHYSTLIVLVSCGTSPMTGTIVGSLAGLLTHYMLSSQWVFADAEVGHTRFLRFFLASTLALLLNALLVWFGLANGLHYLVAQGASTLLVLSVNYALQARWTFARRDVR